MEFDRNEFKRKFPHLYKELGQPEERDSVRVGTHDANVDLSSGYMPEVVSYIRRARTNDEAAEIVDYLRKRGEISEKEARNLIDQIEEKGVRSFGSLRAWGHYEREFRKKIVRKYDDEEEHT